LRFIRINQFYLDIQSHRLINGDNSVALPSDVYSLLRYFCNHPLRTVDIAEIGKCLKQKQPNLQTVTPVIEKIKQLLDDDNESYRMVVRSDNGYRFVANVEWLTELPAGESLENMIDSELQKGKNWLWFSLIGVSILIPFFVYYLLQ